MTRVAVLYGGISAEREVSLSSGAQVIAALRAGRLRGDADRGRRRSARAARRARPAARCRVQRAARPLRRGRRDPGRARLARHSLHAFRRARLGAGDGQAGGEGRVRRRRSAGRRAGAWSPSTTLAAADPLPRPYVVKPLNEGSSVGVEIVRDGRQPPRRDRARLALRPDGAGRGIHPRPRTDRRRDGRPRARGDRDRAAPGLLRLRSEIRRTAARAMSSRRRSIPTPTRARWTWRWRRIARSAAAAPRAPISATTTPPANPAGWCCWRSTRSPA